MNTNTKQSPAPLSMAIPKGVSADAVTVRRSLLIDSGVEPLMAEKLAIDAELAQSKRDQAPGGRKEQIKSHAEDGANSIKIARDQDSGKNDEKSESARALARSASADRKAAEAEHAAATAELKQAREVLAQAQALKAGA